MVSFQDELFSKFSVIARKVQVPSKLVGGLSQDEADTVMKFIYFGFRQQPQEAGTLLKFHDAAYQVGGVGSIVRVLTDKKMPKETV